MGWDKKENYNKRYNKNERMNLRAESVDEIMAILKKNLIEYENILKTSYIPHHAIVMPNVFIYLYSSWLQAYFEHNNQGFITFYTYLKELKKDKSLIVKLANDIFTEQKLMSFKECPTPSVWSRFFSLFINKE